LKTQELEENFEEEAETGKSLRFWFAIYSHMYLKTRCKRTNVNPLLISIFLFLKLKDQELEENLEDKAETGKSLRF